MNKFYIGMVCVTIIFLTGMNLWLANTLRNHDSAKEGLLDDCKRKESCMIINLQESIKNNGRQMENMKIVSNNP